MPPFTDRGAHDTLATQMEQDKPCWHDRLLEYKLVKCVCVCVCVCVCIIHWHILEFLFMCHSPLLFPSLAKE